MGDKVEGMFGIIVVKYGDADPVQKAGHVQISPRADAQVVQILQVVEKLQGQPVHLLHMQ
ncbi:hypothetical protein D3C75_1151610 [compost metagenome]